MFRVFLLAICTIFLFGNNVEASSKILVTYFSHSGTTQQVAEEIANLTGADLFRIVEKNPYPSIYRECTELASREVAENARPEILNRIDNFSEYDTIFLGYPIWWYNAPMIIDTFLESYDFAGKKIIPFCTSGGSPIGVSMDKIRLHCPDSEVIDGLTANDISTVAPWIHRLGFRKVIRK